MARWPTFVPFGKITVTGGTPLALSTNCGPLGGQTAAPGSGGGVPGTALRQIVLTNSTGNALAYLLPRGSTAASNPGNILAVIFGGQTVAFPYGQPFENGILPENFVIDADAATTISVIGYGILS